MYSLIRRIIKLVYKYLIPLLLLHLLLGLLLLTRLRLHGDFLIAQKTVSNYHDRFQLLILTYVLLHEKIRQVDKWLASVGIMLGDTIVLLLSFTANPRWPIRRGEVKFQKTGSSVQQQQQHHLKIDEWRHSSI